MTIFFNDQPVLVESGCTLAGFLQTQGIKERGSLALALNNQVVPKEKWKDICLRENDKILLIGASYGG